MAANVQDTAKDVVHSAPVRALGRAGLVAYGVVHMLIAALAVQVAFGDSEQVDKSGALGAIAANGFGVAVLWLIVVALGALVVWQLAEAVWGHRGLPLGRRLLRSAVNVGEAVVFGVLARSAASIAAAGGNKPKASLAATLFGLPGGRFLVGLIGVAILVGAGYAVYLGVTAKFLRDLDLRGAGLRRSFLVTRLGRVGWTALGAAYATGGVLFVVATVRYDPAQPVGLDAGLGALAAQPFGQVLLVLLALGLGVFGVYCLFDARYREA